MTSLKQTMRSLLTEVEKFLVETLKGAKLSSTAKDEKDRILEKVRQLLDEIPGSASSQLDNSFASGGSYKTSGGGDSGGGSASGSFTTAAGDDEAAYNDDIAKVAASDLKNKLQSGLLDKKKKTGFKNWEQLYCVVSQNIFYIYKKQTDAKQKEAFCLTGYEFNEAPGLEKDASKKESCFELTKAGAPSYQFRAGSKDGMVHWREAITKGIQMGPEEEESGELYDYLDPIAEPHSYVNFGEQDQYENFSDVPTTVAPPLPRNPPPCTSPTSKTGAYQNLPQGQPRTKQPTSPSSSKSVGAPPPVIDITKECSTDGEAVATESVRDRLKRLNQNAESKPSFQRPETKRADSMKSANRVSSPPAYVNQGSELSAVEIYDDLEEVPASKKTPSGKASTLPGNQNRGRVLPPPPTASAASTLRPKSEAGASKASAANPTPEAEQLPPPDSVKNLKKLFQ